ncbi:MULTISPECIES: hypothetical protein [Rhizobium/Agrobacterium group]|uniref:Uncharacterized protein n=1 Tax=Rhizobium rhizogenes TaxID=359 RepID=A0A546XI15_RHIRH|nr:MULTISPECIES: hypothetical protein [Rhizobium/Agrobacterium group]TRB00389.1 hypothetical protein EXN68_11755 [Rhizobium rhizogenes]
MNQSVKRVFEEKPEYLKSDFLDHIRQIGLPTTWRHITNEEPPRDGVDVILQDFVISRDIIASQGYATCPICSPIKPKYVKGHLLYSRESKALYAVGHCCGHGFFGEGSLAKALNKNSDAQRRREAERFIEANWRAPFHFTKYWATLKQSVRDLDAVLKAIRVGLRPSACRDIHRATRDGGYLKIRERIDTALEDGPAGMRSAERLFGERPVQGITILRGGSRGPLSTEAPLSNLAAAFSHISWETENDAILWLCEQVDRDVFLLKDFIEEAFEGVAQALADIDNLLLFLQPENLKLIGDWSLTSQGFRASVSIENEDGRITIFRGGRRHRTFNTPPSLLNAPRSLPPKRLPSQS